ncbi:MAG: OmpH family outer membrane protein [Bacteroidetes bacterium]|nr:MAG: OmpH family outer membrane protein [Bacteroidota bacterium]
MKKLMVVLVAVMSMSTMMAQTKVAHVNSQTLLDSMPSRQSALKQLKEFEAAGVKELQEMEADLQEAYKKYMANQAELSPVMKQYEEEKIQKKQMAMQQREQELQQQIGNLSNDLNEPILKRVQEAVKIVAERKKIGYVIDESTTLYFSGGMDITNDVMKELIRLDQEAMKGQK